MVLGMVLFFIGIAVGTVIAYIVAKKDYENAFVDAMNDVCDECEYRKTCELIGEKLVEMEKKGEWNRG